mgnify:CR=1 FL=1
MEEFVRPATSDDVDELVRLDRAHRRLLESAARGGTQWLNEHPEPGRAGWALRCSESSWQVFVAGVDSVVLGMLSLTIASDGADARIDQVFVEEEARELGLGDGLVEAALEGARRSGCRAVESTALPGDRDTKNLFERFGLVARAITVRRDLGS